MCRLNEILRYFSPEIRKLLEMSIGGYADNIQEIRLRCGKPVAVSSYGKVRYISGGQPAYKVSRNDIEYTFQALCNYSVHSYQNEIAQSFITVKGGHRAGIAGSAVLNDNHITSVKYISSINFRIASQIKGCSDRIYSQIFSQRPEGLLVAGVPSSGKTTFLRDLCRNLSEKYCVSVIDERGEIGAVYHGEPQNDLGMMCDVFDGYPKAEGLQTALRVMSPDIAVCDEIGGESEVRQLLSCVNAGVKIIASAHAGSVDELYRRKNIKILLENGVFDYIVMLGKKENTGRAEKIVRVSDYDYKAHRHNNDNDMLSACGYCDVVKAVRACENSRTADKSC